MNIGLNSLKKLQNRAESSGQTDECKSIVPFKQGIARQNIAQQVRVQHSKAQQGRAWQGRAQQGRAQQGRAQQDRAQQDIAQQGRAQQDRAQHGKAEHIKAVKDSRAQPTKFQYLILLLFGLYGSRVFLCLLALVLLSVYRCLVCDIIGGWPSEMETQLTLNHQPRVEEHQIQTPLGSQLWLGALQPKLSVRLQICLYANKLNFAGGAGYKKQSNEILC